MKNFITAILYTVLFVIFILPDSSFGQRSDSTVPDQYNFFKILEWNKKMLAGKKLDTATKDGEAEKLQRWQHFWESRVPSNGDIRFYSRKMEEYYSSSLKMGTSGVNLCQPDCGNICFPSNWSYFGPDLIPTQNLGKVNAVWVNPANENNIILGADGGAFRTTDSGLNWKCITDKCLPAIGVYHISVQPDNTNIIYLSTGYLNGVSLTDHIYGYGVYKTTDGGVSWVKMNIPYGIPEHGFSYKTLIHPVLYSNVYAVVGPKLYKSINSGATWVEIFGTGINANFNPNNLTLCDIELKITGTTDELYLSSRDKDKDYNCLVTPAPDTYNWGTIGSFCMTKFTAKAWQFTSNTNSLIPVAPASVTDLSVPGSTLMPTFTNETRGISICFTSKYRYIACETGNFDNPGGKIFRKLNSASLSTPWEFCNVSGSEFSLPFEATDFGTNTTMYHGGANFRKAVNANINFTTHIASFTAMHGSWDFFSVPAKAGYHRDHRYITIYGSNTPGTDKVFWGNDGGIGKTINSGVTSSNLNGKGLQLTQLYGISNTEILPTLVYAGAQDNGFYDNKIQSWRVYPYGDGYNPVTDEQNPPNVYCTTNGSLMNTTLGGLSWNFMSYPSGYTTWVTLLYNNNNLYFCNNNIFKKSGSTWSQVTYTTGNSQISDFELNDAGTAGYFSKSAPTWGGARTDKIYKLGNLTGSPTVSDISAGLDGIDWAGITSLATDDAGEKLWVCFGGLWTSNKKVFVFDNNTGAWNEYGQGLPNIPANCIEYLKGSDDMLFIGMDDGVWYRDRNMTEWKKFSCNLPRTIVSDLKINYSTRKLRAGTYGRGIWEASIPAMQNNSSCSSSLLAIQNVTGQTSNPNTLSNGQIVPVMPTSATVTVNLSNYCTGANCCGTSVVTWKVYKDNVLYQSGTGDIISFSGQFKSGFGGFIKYKYRVEVSIMCGNSFCPDIIYNFNGM